MSNKFLASSGKAIEANPRSLTMFVMRSMSVNCSSVVLARDKLKVVVVDVLLQEKMMFRLMLFILINVLKVMSVEPFGLGFAGVA